MAVKILDKIVYKFSNNPKEFLKGLTTNNIDAPITAFLDKFAKTIVVCDQFFAHDEVYLLFYSEFEKIFLEHINKYLPFSETKMQKMDYKVAYSEQKIGEIQIKQKKGFICLTKENIKEDLSKEDFTKIRLKNFMPVQGIDFTHEMFLEVNIPDSISFTKGCYLGQEIIARVTSRAKPVKRLVIIESREKVDTITVQNKEVGKITSICNDGQKYLAFAIIKKYSEQLDNGKIYSYE
jgi:tRNA-modifying protein YgfZ